MADVINLRDDWEQETCFACDECDGDAFSIKPIETMLFGTLRNWSGTVELECLDCGKTQKIFLDFDGGR